MEEGENENFLRIFKAPTLIFILEEKKIVRLKLKQLLIAAILPKY
jgi:hypothetical protein